MIDAPELQWRGGKLRVPKLSRSGFKWGFAEGLWKDKFAFFEAYKNPTPKRRKLLAKRPFLQVIRALLKKRKPLNWTGSVLPLLRKSVRGNFSLQRRGYIKTCLRLRRLNKYHHKFFLLGLGRPVKKSSKSQKHPSAETPFLPR